MRSNATSPVTTIREGAEVAWRDAAPRGVSVVPRGGRRTRQAGAFEDGSRVPDADRVEQPASTIPRSSTLAKWVFGIGSRLRRRKGGVDHLGQPPNHAPYGDSMVALSTSRRVFALALLVLPAFGCARDAEPVTLPPTESLARERSEEVPERIEVRVLVVAHREVEGSRATRTKEQARDRAELITQMARSGRSLSELRKDYDDRRDLEEGQGLFKLETSNPAPFDARVLEAALELRPGRISDPIEFGWGYLVLERLPDPPPEPERIAARHILITYVGSPQKMPGATRSEVEARALAERIAAEAKSPDADWNALAAEYTEEPGSKETGGDLGRFGRGQMVPAFENVAFELDVGEVSEVVQSPFGFHVIQRYE